jgi:hypothetical protein
MKVAAMAAVRMSWAMRIPYTLRMKPAGCGEGGEGGGGTSAELLRGKGGGDGELAAGGKGYAGFEVVGVVLLVVFSWLHGVHGLCDIGRVLRLLVRLDVSRLRLHV